MPRRQTPNKGEIAVLVTVAIAVETSCPRLSAAVGEGAGAAQETADSNKIAAPRRSAGMELRFLAEEGSQSSAGQGRKIGPRAREAAILRNGAHHLRQILGDGRRGVLRRHTQLVGDGRDVLLAQHALDL